VAGGLPTALAACDSEGAEPSAPTDSASEPAESADTTLVERARRDAVALAARYDAALRRHPGLRRRLATPRAELGEHVRVLDGVAGGSAEPGPRQPAPASARVARRDLATAELAALRSRRRDAGAAESGELGRLLASMAACHAQHTQLLAAGSVPEGATPPDPGDAAVEDSVVVDALNDTLAGEHAALYAYGVIGGRLDYDSRPVREATAAWETHQRRRAGLTALVESGGGSPVSAEPGYRLPTEVRRVSDARTVAQTVEDRCGVLYATLAATTTGEIRSFAVDALIDAATRAVEWGAPTSALPGVDASAASRVR
jgi:Domain of unknown function (DUF4439)